MLTFKQFLEESVKLTPRQSIKKFVDMDDSTFNKFISEIKSNQNKITSDTKIYSKLDGFNIHFGKDEEGKFFLESSRSGVQYKPNFHSYTKVKTADPIRIERSKHYDELFKILESSDLVKLLPNDTKIWAEVMMNAMATQTQKGIRFVTVTYDKTKLGKILSLFPYDVLIASTGGRSPDYREILAALLKKSNSNIKVIDPKLHLADAGLNVSEVLKTFGSDIQENKKKLASFILDSKDIIGKDKLGSEIEGVVIYLYGKPFKITTKKFQEEHNKQGETK